MQEFRNTFGNKVINSIMRKQGLEVPDLISGTSDLNSVGLISGSATARSENALRQQQATQSSLAMMAPTQNVTTSSNIQNTNVSGSDAAMTEGAFLARKFAQQRAGLFA